MSEHNERQQRAKISLGLAIGIERCLLRGYALTWSMRNAATQFETWQDGKWQAPIRSVKYLPDH